MKCGIIPYYSAFCLTCAPLDVTLAIRNETIDDFQGRGSRKMYNGTNATTPFHIYKSLVAEAAGIAVDQMHLGRLHAAFDIGEPIWMIADEMRLRAESAMPPVKPVRLPNISSPICVRRVKVAS